MMENVVKHSPKGRCHTKRKKSILLIIKQYIYDYINILHIYICCNAYLLTTEHFWSLPYL